ncbi:tabersonine 16-hydroxylase 2-like [Coffea arabica]|uniref:Tabersonine 16-hydroxylase 2-like n=1 Tax=Coffea arabica TaxID=13443 RepID=A0ABM4VY70_COFAR
MSKAKEVSTLLAGHFKLCIEQYPTSKKDKEDMKKVSYASAVGSLMYVMVCTMPDIVHAVGVVSRYLSNPDGYIDADITGDLDNMNPHLVPLSQQLLKSDEILEDILNEHKRKIKEVKDEGQEGEDLVDVLLNVQKSGDFEPQLTDANIKAIIQNIFAASSEASATAMEWAMSEMIRKPQIMKREQDEVRSLFDGQGNVDESRLHELKYLDAIIKEILRLHPSAPLLVPRECGEQCEINGYQIPAKARLFVNARAIGRDPKYWSEAEKFNPSRFLDSRIDFQGDDFEYIPFGAGRRICPGIAFSQPVIQLALAQLLFHFDWKLPGEMKQEELDMTAKFGITMRRKNDLLLIPIPYSRSCLIMDNSTP